MVPFLVDSGSLFSALNEKEAVLMGLDCSSLPDSKGETVGFGGTFRTKVINRLVFLTFKYGNDKYKMRYSQGFRVVYIPPHVGRDEREKLMRYTPSVLGMDVLTKFKVYMDKHKIVLTR